MTFSPKNFLFFLALLQLAACGGGATTPEQQSTYQTLDSSEQATSNLGGVSLRTNGNNGEVVILDVSGTAQHDSGETTLSDGTYELSGVGGFKSGAALTDGASTIISDGSQGFGGNYEFTIAYEQSYNSDGTNFDSFGIAGITTSENDIRTSGTASYVGEAVGLLINSTGGFDLSSGESTVNVSFDGSGSVDVTLRDFEAFDQLTGLAVTAPVDTISIDNMSIVGNRFDGGTLLLTNNGAVVDITSAGTQTAASGVFFGLDGQSGLPAEVGGIVYSSGAGGIVLGQFIAN